MRTTISLLPSEILYSQDTILCYFDARGAYSNQKIGETLDDICEGRCSIYAIPRIRVAKDGNRWVTADNRRLWIFKHLERLGKCRHIQVNVIDYIKSEKRNSTSGGMSVRIRGGDPGGYWHKRQPESQTFGTSNFGRSPTSPSHRNTESDGSGIIIGLLVAGAALVCSFLFGRCSIYDIATIHVVLHNGEWTTADNRRLWVFRELERLGKCTEIPVIESYYIPDAKLTSTNDGQSVRVRRNPGGIWHRKPSKASATGYTLGTGSHFGSSNRSYVYPASRPTVAPVSQAYRSNDDFRSISGRYASSRFSDHFMETIPSHSDGHTERKSSQISDNYRSEPRRSTYTPTYREPVTEDESCCTIL